MKNFKCLIIILFISNIAMSQNYDSIFNKSIAQELRMKRVIANMSNYDKIIGQNFKEFSAKDITGKEISSKDILGKITFINFWFNSCSPCHKEFPEINKLYIHYKENINFQIITLTFDGIEETKKVAEKNKLLYKIGCLSNEKCHALMYDKGFPSNYLLDETGKIIYGHNGFGSNNEMLLSESFIPKIDSLIKIYKNR